MSERSFCSSKSKCFIPTRFIQDPLTNIKALQVSGSSAVGILLSCGVRTSTARVPKDAAPFGESQGFVFQWKQHRTAVCQWGSPGSWNNKRYSLERDALILRHYLTVLASVPHSVCVVGQLLLTEQPGAV